jgi:mannose-6-phosphate isomerase-like protein (cupin superfamily)
MNTRILLTSAATTIVLLAALGADQPQKPAVVHIEHEKVSAAFASSGRLLVTDRFKVQTGRRTGPGEVEIHEHDTDIFYVLEGSAAFVTGGTAVDTKVSGPGETRARTISGGETRHLSKGDVIVIPANVPHQFTEVTGTFLYYVVKVTN